MSAVLETNKLYGITHDPKTGAAVVRIPRSIKVGIGMPAGKSIHVFLQDNKEKPWVVSVDGQDHALATKVEAQQAYMALWKTAPDSRYPRKLPYFTFTKLSAQGVFVPDWEAIEQHGPKPSEIDVIFTDNEALESAYQYWTATKLQCYGNGINAKRSVDFPKKTKEEEKLAEAARDQKERYYDIIEGCWTCGCPFAGKECKPHVRLSFQLVKSPRLGSKACFDSTSIRSAYQLSSCIQEFKTITGGGMPDRGFIAGIPLKLVLRPFKVNPEGGKPGTAFGVSLEFRSEDVASIKRKLIEAAYAFHNTTLVAPPPKMLHAPDEGEKYPIDDPEGEVPAEALVAEFYPDNREVPPEDHGEADTPEPAPQTPSEKAAAATEERSEELKGKLRSRRPARTATQSEPAPPPAAEAQPPAEEPAKDEKPASAEEEVGFDW